MMIVFPTFTWYPRKHGFLGILLFLTWDRLYIFPGILDRHSSSENYFGFFIYGSWYLVCILCYFRPLSRLKCEKVRPWQRENTRNKNNLICLNPTETQKTNQRTPKSSKSTTQNINNNKKTELPPLEIA